MTANQKAGGGLRTGRFILGVAVLLSVIFSATAQSNPPAWDATDIYRVQKIEGWTVRVNPKLAAETNLCAAVLKLLGAQLYQISRVVPAAPLAQLRQIPIWVEQDDPLFPGACYHESADWLRGHGVNPDKVNGVELANAKNFLTWTKEQPWMVLHELAHGFHHQFLGDDHAGIRRCYARAVAAKIYENVLRSNGQHERHYALNNEKEFFAEMTEAFFGTNDFYPFVRAELAAHDPEMLAVLRAVWQAP